MLKRFYISVSKGLAMSKRIVYNWVRANCLARSLPFRLDSPKMTHQLVLDITLVQLHNCWEILDITSKIFTFDRAIFLNNINI